MLEKQTVAEGQVITFYSFKGGVGRTMALANAAFLAAMSGKRCLVMDWDLEAPGLLHYFRGQLNLGEFRELREAPGVLDFVWEWTNQVSSPDVENARSLISRFESGAPFAECTNSLVGARLLPDGASLDYIGPGGRLVKMPDPRPYEEALVQFSWPTFLNQHAGGIVLSSLREWAKSNYDIVFVDSRTGFADVAGICTMQLPDVVALCFIFNRQNIEGTARVAAAIRQERSDAVQLRAVPMRVARAGTPEDADARARAIAELTRVGGFTPENIKSDFEVLEVKAADGVPFYETLAPFVAVTPRLDMLTLNYLTLGSALTQQELRIPELEPEFVELVKRRLQPRHATADYLEKLRSAQPERAAAELRMFLEAATETALSGDLDQDYASLLVDASMSWSENFDDISSASEISKQTIQLTRTLAAGARDKWQSKLATALQQYLDVFPYELEEVEELAMLQELDELLGGDESTANRLLRMTYLLRAAGNQYELRDYNLAGRTIGRIEALIEVTSRVEDLSSEQRSKLLTTEAEARYLTAELELAKGNVDGALSGLEELLAYLQSEESSIPAQVVRGIAFKTVVKLAQTLAAGQRWKEAGQQAVAAAKLGDSRLVGQFIVLTDLIIKGGVAEAAREFLRIAFANEADRKSRQFMQHFGRGVARLEHFLRSIVGLVRLASKEGQYETESADLTAVADIASRVLTYTANRTVPLSLVSRPNAALEAATELARLLAEKEVQTPELAASIEALERSTQRPLRRQT